MVNIIWLVLIVVGIMYGLFTNNLEVVNNTIVDSTKISLDMLFKIFPVIALWMGLTKIAEKSKLLEKLSNKLSPILTKLFPEIPKGHESLSLIASNMIANIFGLGSAATPFGLKTMSTFLVINTSGLTIIPTTIISLRMMYGSLEPTKIVFACIISTAIATIGGIIVDRMLARRYKN